MVKALRATCVCGESYIIPSSLKNFIVLCKNCEKPITKKEELIVEDYVLRSYTKKNREVIESTKSKKEEENTDLSQLKEVNGEDLVVDSSYFWVSDNFRKPKLVNLVRIIDENFCEVEYEGNVYKTLIRKLRRYE
jgi:hypothetical protein